MEWTENIIIADADYADRVAFDLTVNFERMIGRRIPKADMARWVECIALDGGMRPDESQSNPERLQQTQVVLIHDDGRQLMENFTPGHYADELHGKAFKGPLGEFTFTCSSPEGMTTKEGLLLDTLAAMAQSEQVRRIMVVPADRHADAVGRFLRRQRPGQCAVTLFAMQPLPGGHFAQELLGYSLMAALGVKGSELKPDDM